MEKRNEHLFFMSLPTLSNPNISGYNSKTSGVKRTMAVSAQKAANNILYKTFGNRQRQVREDLVSEGFALEILVESIDNVAISTALDKSNKRLLDIEELPPITKEELTNALAYKFGGEAKDYEKEAGDYLSSH